ncbi:MAG: peptidylprolyl isomerase [Bacilli bacterium]|nr:peptidylprolyl isomerase [Bacilli bacterium]
MKNIKKIVVASMCLLLLTGCGEKTIPTLENGEEIITTLKDDRKISISQLYNELKDQYGLNTLMNMIDKIILEDKYSSDIDGAKEKAESTINQLKENYGDNLLSAIQYYTNYNSIEDYQNSLYISNLQEKAVTAYAKTKIKDSEIEKYYKEEIKPDIKVSHILITADYPSEASDDEKKAAEENAKKTAEEVISKLNDAQDKAETFKSLASEYSKDESTKNDGGNLGFINTNTLGDSYKKMVDKAYELKDGEYSKEAVKTELGYHIVLRTETKEKASLEEVKDTILDNLAEKYVTDNQDAQIKAMQELRKEYDMNIIDDDVHQQYVNYIQNSLAQIQANASNASKSSSKSSK